MNGDIHEPDPSADDPAIAAVARSILAMQDEAIGLKHIDDLPPRAFQARHGTPKLPEKRSSPSRPFLTAS